MSRQRFSFSALEESQRADPPKCQSCGGARQHGKVIVKGEVLATFVAMR